MANNKVSLYGTVLIDLTEDTVTAETLLEGHTAHDASGALIVGTLKNRLLTPLEYDYVPGYTTGGAWVYENSVNNHTDIYAIESGHIYTMRLGQTVGTRFRAGYAETDPRTISSGRISGTQVVNTTNPTAGASVTFTSSLTGYLYVTKDNAGTSGLKTWLFDITSE